MPSVEWGRRTPPTGTGCLSVFVRVASYTRHGAPKVSSGVRFEGPPQSWTSS